jgi:hypothetical protein
MKLAEDGVQWGDFGDSDVEHLDLLLVTLLVSLF